MFRQIYAIFSCRSSLQFEYPNLYKHYNRRRILFCGMLHSPGCWPSKFQLKVDKEAMYIKWEKPILNQQLKHLILSLSRKLSLIFFLLVLPDKISTYCNPCNLTYYCSTFINQNIQIVTNFYNWRWHRFAETCLVNLKLLSKFLKLFICCSRVRFEKLRYF